MINTQPKNKILILIIGILLIANIVTLSFMLMNKCKRPAGGKHDRRAMITAFLEKEVGFSKEQLVQYDSLSKHHRNEMSKTFEKLAEKRENALRYLAMADFNDSSLHQTSSIITNDQNDFEIKMLQHIKSIRSICTAAQKVKFDSGFYKIISKRNEVKKAN